MKALLRYAIVKGIREKHLIAVVFGPAILIGTVGIGFIVRSLVTGHAFGDTTIVEKLGSALIEVGALSAVIAGGGGTFRVFRKELADRSVASLVLASRPSMIVLAAMIYGVTSGVIALVLALLTAGAVTFSSAFPLPMFLYGCFAIIVATAAAIAACSISPDPAVLVPSLIIMLPLSVSIEMQKMPALIAGAVILFVLPPIASFLVERRCAA